MGAFQGGLTFRRYTVEGELPKDFRDRFHQGITKYTFRPIDPGGEEERALPPRDDQAAWHAMVVVGARG